MTAAQLADRVADYLAFGPVAAVIGLAAIGSLAWSSILRMIEGPTRPDDEESPG